MIQKSILILLFCLFMLSAQANGAGDLFELSLEELATISVASKKPEEVKVAPGIITLITAEEIKHYGARYLRDILDRQTSLQLIGSNFFPHNRTVSRGAAFTHTDNTVLLTFNGRPIRDSTGISNNTDLYSAFPIESIKQIEIIRGPGSILYGTNAQTGVINIITKEAREKFEGTASVSYGSFNNKQAEISGGVNWKDLGIYTAINFNKTDGDDFKNITDENGTTGTYKSGKSAAFGMFNLQYKGLELNVLLSDIEQDNAHSQFLLPSTDQQIERQYVDLSYNHYFNQNWNLKTDLQYHHYSVGGLNSLTSNGLAKSENYLAEVTLFGKINNQLEILAGGTFDQRDGSLLSGLTYDSYIASTYGQLGYRPFDWIKLIGGFQYNKPEETSGKLSTRFSILANISKEWGLKLLYGEAFRSPTPFERNVNAPPILVGDPSLKPETIKTIDTQIYYQADNIYFATTYFHSVQKDLITRSGTPSTFVNFGKVTYHGIELEGEWTLNNRWSFIGNLSYQTNKDMTGAHDVAISPSWMAKGGVSYDSGHGYQFSIFNSFFGKPTSISDISTGVAEVNPDADSYNLLTANLQINLGEVFDRNSLSNISLSIYADNMLDEDIFYPSINRKAVNTIPHHAGRNFHGTIRIDY